MSEPAAVDRSGELRQTVLHMFDALDAGHEARLALELCPWGVMVVSRDGVITYANPAAAQIAGKERGADLEHRPLSLLIDPARELRHRQGFRREFDQELDVPQLTGPHCPNMRQPDGSLVPVEVIVAFPPGPRLSGLCYVRKA